MNEDLLTADVHTFLNLRLDQSTKLSILVLDDQFNIKRYNTGFSKLLDKKDDLAGKPLKELLLAESRHLLNSAIIHHNMPIRLNFNTGVSGCISLICHVAKKKEGYLLFAENAYLAENDILKEMTTLSNELAALTRDLNRKNIALQKAQSQIKTLSGIIPICMFCKEVRNDEGYWKKVEQFVEEHSDAQFSHGICPDCLGKHYPEDS